MSAHSRAIWSLIGLLIGVDALWLPAAGITVAVSGLIRVFAAVAVAAAIALFYWRTHRSNALMRLCHATAQLLTFSAAAAILSYLVTATHAPLTDDMLAAADRALGFDWSRWYGWVASHNLVALLLALAYSTLLLQIMLCMQFLAAFSSADEFMWTLMIASLTTIAVSGFLPALGNLPNAPFAVEFTALREGQLRHIDLGAAQGLISFPSLHAALALLLIYAVRRWRPLLGAASLVNGMMVLSVPADGGHYLVDVIGGAVVAGISIHTARRVCRWVEASPRSRPSRPDGPSAEAEGREPSETVA
jgi:PAP2 superfamily